MLMKRTPVVRRRQAILSQATKHRVPLASGGVLGKVIRQLTLLAIQLRLYIAHI